MTSACWRQMDRDVGACLMAFTPGSAAFEECFDRAIAAKDACLAQEHANNIITLNASLTEDHEDLTRVPWLWF